MSSNVWVRLLLLALLCVTPIACGNGCAIDTADIGGPVDSNGGSDSPSDDAPTTTPVDGIPEDDDLSDPGDPVAKLSYMAGLEESQGAADHFDFDDPSHWVRTLAIHGTELSVAIDRTVLEAGGGLAAEDFAAYVEAAFHAGWHVFGGYPFDRYAVRVRAEDGNEGFSLSPVGITLSGSDYAAP